MNTPTENQLSQRIMQTIEQTLHEAIAKKLEGYQSPLDDLLKIVFARKAPELTSIMENAMEGALRTTAFKQELRDTFDKKLAKILLASFDGEIERRANKLREDPAFRAKITVAIDAAIKSVTP